MSREADWINLIKILADLTEKDKLIIASLIPMARLDFETLKMTSDHLLAMEGRVAKLRKLV